MNYPTCLASIVLASLLGACGSATPAPVRPTLIGERARPSGPVEVRGEASATGYIGAPGGTLELSNGAKLVIAERSLSEPVEVTLAVAEESAALGHREEQRGMGPAVRISPDIVATNAGATFSFSVPAQAIPDGFTAEDLALAIETPQVDQRALPDAPTRTSWQHYPARLVSGRLTAEIGRLPGYRIQFVVSR